MSKLTKDRNIIFWGITTLIYSAVILFLLNNEKSERLITISVISSAVVLFLQIRSLYVNSKLLFTPGFVYLCSYYIFQNGQLLLYSIAADFDMFYLNKFSTYMIEGAVYSSISNVIAGYIYMLTTFKSQEATYRISNVDKYFSYNSISCCAYQGFVLTGLIALPLILYKFSFALSGGYMAVRAAESSIPSVANFIEYMFPAFSILSIVYNNNGKTKQVHAIFLIWLILTAMCGDRTTGLAGILVLVFLRYKLSTKGNSKKNVVYLILSGFAIISLVSIIANFRRSGSLFDIESSGNFVISFMSELGFSVVPLLSIIEICPKYLSFQYGCEYVQSFIGGCIPSFLDPTGTITYINTLSRNYETFQMTYFGFDSFGIGWSLNAESFHNFGWYGLIALIFINYIVFSFLNKTDFRLVKRDFNLYAVCALLFMWITLPRRDSYYIWKAIVYTIIFIQIFIRMRCAKKH